MNILVFDTCFEACSVAAVRSRDARPDGVTARYEPMAQGHAERLIPMIAEAMAEAGLGFGELDRIGVTVGPGSFTGTRIGVAAARALALAHGTPLVGLSPLAVMAAEAGSHADAARAHGRPILVCADVRRGEAYCQLFDSRGMVAHGEPQLMTFTAAAAIACAHAVWAVGSAAAAIVERAPTQGDCIGGLPALLPCAQYAVTLVKSSLDTTQTVVPLYLRPPDAKPPVGDQLTRLDARSP